VEPLEEHELMLIDVLIEDFKARGVPVKRMRMDWAHDWASIRTSGVEITIEQRPRHCDRGNFIVKLFPESKLDDFDAQDGFPRYYFGIDACVSEICEWMRVRGLLNV
jgi:hypothetical protein